MNKKKLIKHMKNVVKNQQNDIEMLHFQLDDLLLEYINDKEVTKIFNSAPKWYS